MYEAIFLTVFVLGWLICGYLPWFAMSLVTRGGAGLRYLPLCLLAGLIGGLAVPLLIRDDAPGLWLSALFAVGLPALLMGAQRLAAGTVVPHHRVPASPATAEVELPPE